MILVEGMNFFAEGINKFLRVAAISSGQNNRF